ncbi:MAG: TlpA family protein disulfide reductase [Acidobacteria bacterium]|nr:TlpA family protein disulfide reductase [Acidobacteriota bacterium]
MILSFLLAALLAQQPAGPNNTSTSKEDQDLEQSLSEAGGSPVEYARALERHLKKYPNSERRGEYQRVLAQAAIDLRDKRRLLLYGVPVLEAGSRNPQLLDHVTRTLLDREDATSATEALKYSRLLVQVMDDQRKAQLDPSQAVPARGRRLEETEYALARARTFEARALSILGKFDESDAAALAGWAVSPTEENARERARNLERAGKFKEALAAFSEALALAGDRSTSADAAKDGARLASLSKQASGQEGGFGSVMLAAYDRAAAAQAAQKLRLKSADPNYAAAKPLEFTLTATTGPPLDLSTLKGKVVVIDFWATWCGPCRAQHPLYEQVKAKFKSTPDVVFLAVSTDEDRGVVAPFLKAQKWPALAYFEDGMASTLRISSIPTAMILDRQGNIVSRMNGYIADRFVNMMSDRIQEALEEK